MDSVQQNDVKNFYDEAFKDEKKHSLRAFESVASEEYQNQLFQRCHPELLNKNFGCGHPFPTGNLSGFDVLDLGSGLGRDCFVMSALVGDEGSVTGVDMSDEGIAEANKYKEYHRKEFGLKKDNVSFKKGNIENLKECGIEDESKDVVISNCVINLAMNKENVFKEVYRVLRYGGEMYFADVYSSLRLPQKVRENKELWGSCVAGSLYVSDFIRMMKRIGFSNLQIVKARIVGNKSEKLQQFVDVPSCIYSITFRMFKMPSGSLEEFEEDYGQKVTFLGDRYKGNFKFSRSLQFEKGKPKRVSGNIAAILQKSKYSKYFKIDAKGTHRGRFEEGSEDLWTTLENAVVDLTCTSCSGGSCSKPQQEENSNSCGCGGEGKNKKKQEEEEEETQQQQQQQQQEEGYYNYYMNPMMMMNNDNNYYYHQPYHYDYGYGGYDNYWGNDYYY